MNAKTWISNIICHGVFCVQQQKSTLNIFYCSKRPKDKTQVKRIRLSSPITYITKQREAIVNFVDIDGIVDYNYFILLSTSFS